MRFCFYFVLSFFVACFSNALELHQRQSSYIIMSPQTKAMQDDPTLNPATFWIMDGESLWTQKPSPQSPACNECHGQVNTSMKGVSATFPKSVK
ncbi:MAG: sulfur oxidation c-type cytochrome SoxA, partial [Betaproteobacteria bacterium]|nr:sulfur oxidation c-type cytochrome SoxA [Betaproteobacteria bacterium]